MNNGNVRAIVYGVLLNHKAQAAWIANVDPVFLLSLDVFRKRYLKGVSSWEAFRTGAIVGGLYEQRKEKGGKAMSFSPGQIVMTIGVADLAAHNQDFTPFMLACLTRHLSEDWGDVSSEDLCQNEAALTQGNRLFSSYTDKRFPKHGTATIWIITEANRSVTTILFPDEY